MKNDNPNYEFVNSIDEMNYRIQATSQRDGWSRLYLVEDGTRVSSVDFRSNNESIKIVRERLASTGEKPIAANSYLFFATEALMIKAIAHTLANDKPEGVIAHHIKAKFDSATNHLLDKALQVYGKSVHEFTSNLTGVKYPAAVHEKNLLVKQIESMGFTLDVKNSSGSLLRIYVVNDKEKQVGYSNTTSSEGGLFRKVSDIVDRIEGREKLGDNKIDRSFIDALKEARAIALVDAYRNNTMSKPEMLNIAKQFDDRSKSLLEQRLSIAGIDKEKFQNDLKEAKTVKHKNKM